MTVPLPPASPQPEPQFRLSVSKDYIFLTFQGEGPRLGTRTVFLRLAGCNLSCTWCDTPYTWDWKHYNVKEETLLKPIESIAEDLEVQSVDCHSLTITGGEPLLQAKALDNLFLILEGYKEINFETNGTIFPQWTNPPCPVHYVVSPKLTNSGCPSIILNEFIEEGADFKFVCTSPQDLVEVQLFHLPPSKVWIMPEGTDPDTLTARAQYLAQPVLERGWNLTTRFHQYLWDNARGR